MTSTHFAEIPIPDFVDIILAGGERGDEAMFYLLHHRMERQLKLRFEKFQHKLTDGFDDVLEDFFLYLRDGGRDSCEVSYPSLRRIRNKEAFEAWMLNTFRNYITMLVDSKKTMVCSGLKEEDLAEMDVPTSALSDERKLEIASTLIAYAHQILSYRERFILLRTMLSMLNKSQALPNDKVACVLGMSAISYRVTVHRLKRNLVNIRTRLISGEIITLDNPHLQMAQRINKDFSQLYQTLLVYYSQSIDGLHNAAAVKQLRQEYYNTTGLMLHENKCPYHITIKVSTFWTRLTEFLIV